MTLDYSQMPMGWDARLARETFDESIDDLRASGLLVSGDTVVGSGKGKVVLLHKIVEQVRGSFPVYRQTIGDCVSQGWALAIDIVKCVQVAARQTAGYTGDSATEVIYAGSRVEIGGGRIGGDGSVGAWAARLVSDPRFGTLPRGVYGPIDLRTYSGARAREWGRPRAGIPNDLEPRMREHIVRSVKLVTTYEEARDAIANGYPIPVCSDQGFASRRDEKGFARPQGSWAHCMAFVGVDDADSRPGLLCCNSWGPDWIGGPRRHGQPEGSFWVDAATAERMLRQRDSFAVSQYAGYPVQELDYSQI